MMRPPRGVWSFIMRNASCVQRNAPVRLTSTTAFHCSKVSSSSGTGRRAGAGVVEQHVEAAEGGFRFAKQGFDERGIAHVGGNRDGSCAKRPSLRPLFERLLASAG